MLNLRSVSWGQSQFWWIPLCRFSMLTYFCSINEAVIGCRPSRTCLGTSAVGLRPIWCLIHNTAVTLLSLNIRCYPYLWRNHVKTSREIPSLSCASSRDHIVSLLLCIKVLIQPIWGEGGVIYDAVIIFYGQVFRTGATCATWLG